MAHGLPSGSSPVSPRHLHPSVECRSLTDTTRPHAPHYLPITSYHPGVRTQPQLFFLQTPYHIAMVLTQKKGCCRQCGQGYTWCLWSCPAQQSGLQIDLNSIPFPPSSPPPLSMSARSNSMLASPLASVQSTLHTAVTAGGTKYLNYSRPFKLSIALSIKSQPLIPIHASHEWLLPPSPTSHITITPAHPLSSGHPGLLWVLKPAQLFTTLS